MSRVRLEDCLRLQVVLIGRKAEGLTMDLPAVFIKSEILEKRRGRTIDIAILIIIHRGVEAFPMRSSLHGSFKLLVHLVELL